MKVFPVRGMNGPRPIWPKRSTETKRHEHIFLLGVDTAKDWLYARLRISKPGPGYFHFPIADEIDGKYFAQLTSEQIRTKKLKGKLVREWFLPPGRRNEALDTAVYALAARMATRLRLDKDAPAAGAGVVGAQPMRPPPVEDFDDEPTPTPIEPAPDSTSATAPVPRGVRHSHFEPGGGWLGPRGWFGNK